MLRPLPCLNEDGRIFFERDRDLDRDSDLDIDLLEETLDLLPRRCFLLGGDLDLECDGDLTDLLLLLLRLELRLVSLCF